MVSIYPLEKTTLKLGKIYEVTVFWNWTTVSQLRKGKHKIGSMFVLAFYLGALPDSAQKDRPQHRVLGKKDNLS